MEGKRVNNKLIKKEKLWYYFEKYSRAGRMN